MRIFFVVLFAVLANEIQAIPLNETFIDFEENVGFFNQFCQPGIAIFQRDRYDNHFFPKPDNTSQQFFTSSRPACIQTPLFEASDEVEVVFHMFRFAQLGSALETYFVNSAGTILKNASFSFDKVYNWTDEVFSYPPKESFRIRLLYRTQNEGTFMAINSITINLNDYTPPIQNFTGCMKEDTFPLSLEGQFYPCSQLEFSDFQRMQYSNTTILNKPLGANDYFMTVPNHGNRSCMEYPYDILLEEGTEVILSIYTDNEDAKAKDWATLFAFDSFTSNTTVEIVVLEIDNSRTWRKVSMKMRETAVVKLKLYTQDFSNSKAFIAIDSMGIKDSDSEDCTNNCQCTITNIEMYASTENQGSTTSFGLTTIIISTTVVVSLLWGVVITAFVYRKRRLVENNVAIVGKENNH